MSVQEFVPRKEFEERHHVLQDQVSQVNSLALNTQILLHDNAEAIRLLVEKQHDIDKSLAVMQIYIKIVGPAITAAAGIIGYLLGVKV